MRDRRPLASGIESITVQRRQVPSEGDCLARERIELPRAIECQRLLEALSDDCLPLDGTHRQHNLLADCPRGGHRDDTVTDRGLRVVLAIVEVIFNLSVF